MVNPRRALTIRYDTMRSRALAIALKLAPLGHMLLDRVPDEFVYQRCYVTSTHPK